MKRNLRQTLLPLLTAMIWGAAFSAQSVCSEYLGPFTINALRFFIAFLVLLPVCLLRRKGGALRDIVLGSLLSGTALFAASAALLAARMAPQATTSSRDAGEGLYAVTV